MWRVFRCLPVPVVACGVAFAGVLGVSAVRTGSSPPTSALPPAHPFPDVPTWESDDRMDVSKSNASARHVIVWRVAVGSLTLLQAAAQMRAIDRRSAHFNWTVFRMDGASRTDAERHCREVIRWAANILPDGPNAEEVRRLDAELQDLLRRGPLVLPDDPEV
jgi:hypothetical protein